LKNEIPQVTNTNHDGVNTVQRNDILRILDTELWFDLGDASNVLIRQSPECLQFIVSILTLRRMVIIAYLALRHGVVDSRNPRPRWVGALSLRGELAVVDKVLCLFPSLTVREDDSRRSSVQSDSDEGWLVRRNTDYRDHLSLAVEADVVDHIGKEHWGEWCVLGIEESPLVSSEGTEGSNRWAGRGKHLAAHLLTLSLLLQQRGTRHRHQARVGRSSMPHEGLKAEGIS
jgi:hypothetical protein